MLSFDIPSLLQRAEKAYESLEFSELSEALACMEITFIATYPSSTFPYYAPQILSLLSEHRLSEARFLWNRISAEAKQDQDVQAAWNLGKSIWGHDISTTYQILRDHSWKDCCDSVQGLEKLEISSNTLAGALHKNVQRRMQESIGKSFETISVSDAAKLLDTTEDQVLDLANQIGSQPIWKKEEGFLVKVPGAQQINLTITGRAPDFTLEDLTRQLVRFQFA